MKSTLFRIYRITSFIIVMIVTINQSWAATFNAASCSQSAVQAAINSASNGDMVFVPAGNCTWTANVNIGSKAITLQGAGVGQTNITNGLSKSQNSILNFTQHATISTRITGFSFLGMGYSHRAINCQGSYTSAPMRIDHNSFYTTSGDGTGGTVEVDIYSCRGLIDNNEFTAPNNAEMIHHYGDGTSGWKTTVVPGSTNALYVENNTFSSANKSTANSSLQNYDGSIVVARYNTIHSSQLDVHGCCSPIGGRWSEFYGNTFINDSPGIDKTFDFRSGGGVVFNNTQSGPTQGSSITFRCDTSPGKVGLGYNYNSYSPVYVWGNTNMSVNTGLNNSGCSSGTNWIVSNTQPTTMKILQTSADTTNTTYSYTPFIYPYPLNANGMPNPTGSSSVVGIQPPTNVSIN
jgi:hypothetical protein